MSARKPWTVREMIRVGLGVAFLTGLVLSGPALLLAPSLLK